LKKLFYTRTHAYGETCYVPYKKFTLIYLFSVILLIITIPVMMIIVTQAWPIVLLTLAVTAMLVTYYIYLWRGDETEKIIYLPDGSVTLIDDDLYKGFITFHINDMTQIMVNVKSGSYQANRMGNRHAIATGAELVIHFANGNSITLGSSTYGGQLKLMRKFLLEKYHSHI
jgi:hypothetical protein